MASLTEEDIGDMVKVFQKAGFEPKSDSIGDFKAWVKGMAEQDSPVVKLEPSVNHTDSTGTKPTYSSAYHYFPKLPSFSGELGKDTDYDVWRYEVDCLVDANSHSLDIVSRAVRQSLKGEAALAAMKLGHGASVADILVKLKSAFGTLRRTSTLMADFYSSHQRSDEDVTAWSCRLERLMYQLSTQKHISSEEQDDMLRTRLWDGLTTELKSLAGYKHESIHHFDELRLCLREMEFDLDKDLNRDRGTSHGTKVKGKSGQVNTTSATVSSANRETDGLSEIKDMIKGIHSELQDMRENQRVLAAQVQSQQTDPDQHRYPRPRYDGKGRGKGQRDYRYTDTPVASPMPDAQLPDRHPVVCYRCGYPGHIAIGCKVRLDHQRKPLNWKGSMGRGHP